MSANMAVGIMQDYPYTSERITLHDGDSILLYTDGVTEAEDTGKRLFGEQALRDAFANAVRNAPAGIRGTVERVYDSVMVHTSGAEQSDDITMLAFTYRGNGTQLPLLT